MLGAGEGKRTLVCSLGSCRSTLNYPALRGQPRSNRITRIWGGEKQAPQAFCRCAAPELRSRPSPTATTFVLGRIFALPAVTEMAPVRISMRESCRPLPGRKPHDDPARQRAGAGKYFGGEYLGGAFSWQSALDQRHADRQGHGALRCRCHG